MYKHLVTLINTASFIGPSMTDIVYHKKNVDYRCGGIKEQTRIIFDKATRKKH